MSALDIAMRTVLRALEGGALLLYDEAPTATLGCYLSFGPDRTPIRRDVFQRLEREGYVAPVMSARLPQRYRATEEGMEALAADAAGRRS